VIKTADWLIDMGPEGGHKGGTVIATGTPEQVAEVPESHTGRFLRPVLGLDPNPDRGSGGPATSASKARAVKKAAAKANRAPAKRAAGAAAARSR
jgi:excinuclease ABC subunit A